MQNIETCLPWFHGEKSQRTAGQPGQDFDGSHIKGLVINFIEFLDDSPGEMKVMWVKQCLVGGLEPWNFMV
jgi:hypothetical protein